MRRLIVLAAISCCIGCGSSKVSKPSVDQQPAAKALQIDGMLLDSDSGKAWDGKEIILLRRNIKDPENTSEEIDILELIRKFDENLKAFAAEASKGLGKAQTELGQGTADENTVDRSMKEAKQASSRMLELLRKVDLCIDAAKVSSMSTGLDGKFTFSELPAGDYVVGAISELPSKNGKKKSLGNHKSVKLTTENVSVSLGHQ